MRQEGADLICSLNLQSPWYYSSFPPYASKNLLMVARSAAGIAYHFLQYMISTGYNVFRDFIPSVNTEFAANPLVTHKQ